MGFRKLCERVRRSDKLRTAFMCACALLPLQRKVVFSSFEGKYFSDSPLAIYREMRGRNLGYRYIWLSRDGAEEIEGARVVQRRSLRACYHLATARCWVDNVRKAVWLRKRKHQIYVQTWHSGLTNKSGEGDEEPKLNPGYIRSAKHDSEMADLFVSGSRWQTEHYRRAFWYDGEILESGLPRADVLFQPAAPCRARVERHFGIAGDVRLALYAPTFRDSGSLDAYNLDCRALICALTARFGGVWKVLVRLHPNVAWKHDAYAYDADVLDASTYPDINELIMASEWLITDYSSCVFDAMEAGRRGALYVPDLEEYRRERGFYWELEELPFLLARTNAELAQAIEGFDEECYAREEAAFKARCGLFDDGKASARVVDRMLQLMEER